MQCHYLLLGASSDVCCAFLRRHDWHEGDKIIAQYFSNEKTLREIQQKISAEMILRQADFSDAESTNIFAESLKAENFCPTHILHVPAVPVENKRFTEIFWTDAEKQFNVPCRSLWQVLQAVMPKMSKAKFGNIVL
ncbi:MAG: SDR family oxidoreductase, partial [Selenomonadaceae bacterium]|nr:SDR family oxidoreductase [Selenomonadaceae bacterium]